MIDDNPLNEISSDKLGFGGTAKYLATAFLQNDLSKGFVVGVEGAWGSGKSSLVNLALEELDKEKKGIAVIKFTPWLVGSRNELLSQLFSDLEPAIVNALPESEKSNTKELLRKYSKLSSGMATFADIAENIGMPWAGIFGKIMKTTSQKAAEMSESSLSELNEDLRNKLKMLKRPIVVFVDDLDRLEPREIVEVLRLVKAVADFPNVAYVIAYDLEVVSASLQKSLGIDDGKKYLEKIVQASFKVPSAMTYDLINWLMDEVSKITSEDVSDDSEKQRLNSVYYSWCMRIVQTPRDVVRILNFMRLHYAPVRQYVDAGDMLFLQSVNTKHHKLYNWIASYIRMTVSASEQGISMKERAKCKEALIEIIKENGFDKDEIILGLAEHLPGIRYGITGRTNDGPEVLNFEKGEFEKYNKDKRMASPHHYSYYFSFSRPAGSIDESEVKEFIDLCVKNTDGAQNYFLRLVDVKRPQGGRLAEVLLQRILELRNSITSSQANGILFTLEQVIDSLVPVARTNFGYVDFLKGRREQIFGIFENIQDKKKRARVIVRMFSEGKSLDWLTGIIREATFAYTPELENSSNSEAQILTLEEFKIAKSEFLRRMAKSSPSELLRARYFLSLMYAWYQLGDKKGSVSFIRENSTSEEDFLIILEKMSSWSDSSVDGVQYKLNQSTIKIFFESELSVKERLTRIINNERAPEEVRIKANRIFNSIETEY